MAISGTTLSWCLILTLNLLNCFKDYKRYIHILYHILGLGQKKTKFTIEQPYMLPHAILTIPCLLMLWQLQEPEHQLAWYLHLKLEYSVFIIGRVNHVIATHLESDTHRWNLRVSHLPMSRRDFDYKTGYQDSCPSNGHQVKCPIRSMLTASTPVQTSSGQTMAPSYDWLMIMSFDWIKHDIRLD